MGKVVYSGNVSRATVNDSLQALKDMISIYINRTDWKNDKEAFLSELMSIENELTKMRNDVEKYRITSAEKLNMPMEYRMSHKGEYKAEQNLTR